MKSSPPQHPKAPGLAVGIDEALIRQLVEAFYAEIRIDPALGPIFRRRISDWGPHLETMVAFWSSIALMTGQYKGKPIQAHMPLGLRATHFARWLALFEQTARRVSPPDAAEFFIGRSQMIARSLKLGVGIIDPLTNQPVPGR